MFNSPLCLFDPYGLSAEEYTNVYPPSFNPDSTEYQDYPGRYEVGIHSIKNGLLTYTNGMNNTPAQAKEQALELSQKFDNVKITVFYNHTHSAWEAKENMRSPVTSPTKMSELQKETYHDFLSKDSEKNKVSSFGHSDGTSHTRKAFESLTLGERSRIYIANFAPAKPTSSLGFARAKNYVSRRDFVPYTDRTLDGLSYGLDNCCSAPPELAGQANYQEAEKDIVVLDPAPGAPLFDHSFNSPTFDAKKREEFDNFKRACENQ